MEHQKLKITSRFISPVSFTLSPHIDGILLYSFLEQNDPEFYSRNIQNDDFEYPKEFETIIQQVEFKENDWFYACSDAIYVKDNVSKTYWHRRTDDKDIENIIDTKKITTTSGDFKSYRMPVILNSIKEMTWYVVGDKEKILSLLQNVKAVGKKARSQGIGEVYKWEVEETTQDYLYQNGMLIKTLPIHYFKNDDDLKDVITDKNIIRLATYRPPYSLTSPSHPKSSFTMCVVPILEKEII